MKSSACPRYDSRPRRSLSPAGPHFGWAALSENPTAERSETTCGAGPKGEPEGESTFRNRVIPLYKAASVRAKTPQLLPQTPQLLPQTPQLLSQTPQLLPQTPQLLPQTPQLLPRTPQLLPQTPQLLPRTP